MVVVVVVFVVVAVVVVTVAVATFTTGLLLLREAWDAVDITEHLAAQYKIQALTYFRVVLSE